MRVVNLACGKMQYWGKRGENNATLLRANAEHYVSEWPDGVPQVVYRRADKCAYNVPCKFDGHFVLIELSKTETDVTGTSTLEVMWVDGENVVKSDTYKGSIDDSISVNTDEVPDPLESYVEKIALIGAEVERAAERVEEAEKHQPIIGDNGNWFIFDTEKGEYVDTEMPACGGGIISEIDAEAVYFSDDLTTTSAIGNITLTNGQATIPAKGKNLREVWDSIFVKEMNPSTTQPSVSLIVSEAQAHEVGTKVAPTYSATLKAGSYSYGPSTGVTATTWLVIDTQGNESTSASGSFTEVTVTDDIDYRITAVATHTAGAVPLTNIGNEYVAGQIAAGSKSASSGSLDGYRNSFYGTMSEKTDIDSAAIRALAGKSGKALADGATFNVSVPVGAVRVVIAYPATLRDVTSIKDVNGLNAEISSGFTSVTMDVEGANNYKPIPYKVYTLDFAKANDMANTFAVTI